MMKAKYLIATAMAAFAFSSCSDMLDTESDRYAYDPALDQKVDSMFYTLGALKAVQQSIDQYVLTNELRGDLAGLTSHASTDLQELYKHNVSATNKYDSAYVYYRVINNCNYYIAHRDTTLSTGANMVAMPEYAEAHALRAWAYLQLARTYGEVPFYTDPLMDVTSIEAVASQPKLGIQEICNALAPKLEQYAAQGVPNWGTFNAGRADNGLTKTVTTSMMMVPVRLVLADLYLETGNYEKAASTLYNYLRDNELTVRLVNATYEDLPAGIETPSDLRGSFTSKYTRYSFYETAFSMNSPVDVITYVPMATNKLRGTTTELPQLFGYNFYSTSDGYRYNDEYSIVPTSAYSSLIKNQTYYYGKTVRLSGENVTQILGSDIGDMRYYSVRSEAEKGMSGSDTTFYNCIKFNGANVPIYRTSGVYLKLAEAINRMGHPRVAFAILKDGITTALKEDTTYIQEDDIDFLTNGAAPFFGSVENQNIFNGVASGSTNTEPTSRGNQAIHARGCGYTQGNESVYQYSTEVQKKWNELGVTVGQTKADTLKASIDAVEDLICDEMALELAFEGSRFSDLCRIARHKNADNPWRANYGSEWLAGKLAFKNVAADLTIPANWYMPFR